MNQVPLVSIVITSLDRRDILHETILRLEQQTYKHIEIIVVHSGKDTTIPKLIRKYVNIKLINLPHQIPDSPARNIGVANATGELILFLDDDSFPGHHCITKAVTEFRRNKLLGVISFRIKDYSIYNKRTYKSITSRHNEQDVYGFSGCGGMMRKSLFDAYGWMPETGQESMFEHTVCLWAWNLEQEVKSFNDIYVYHHLSTEGKAADLRHCKAAMYAGARVTGLFTWQYFSGRELWSRMYKWLTSCINAAIIHIDLKFIGLVIKFLWNAHRFPTYRGQFSETALNKVRLTNNFKGK